jgi:hypothetical protein
MFKELCLYLVLHFGAVDASTCEQVAHDAIQMGAEKFVYDLLSISWHESRFQASAESGVYKGALQCNPKWAAECGEDCTEIQQAIHIFLKFKTKDRCVHISRYMNGWGGQCDQRVQKRLVLANKIKKLHGRLKKGKIKQ